MGLDGCRPPALQDAFVWKQKKRQERLPAPHSRGVNKEKKYFLWITDHGP